MEPHDVATPTSVDVVERDTDAPVRRELHVGPDRVGASPHVLDDYADYVGPIAAAGGVFADAAKDGNSTVFQVRQSSPTDTVIEDARVISRGGRTVHIPAIVATREVTAEMLAAVAALHSPAALRSPATGTRHRHPLRPVRRQRPTRRSGRRRSFAAPAVARNGDPPRPADDDRPRSSRPRADFYLHPILNTSGRTALAGWIPLYVVTTFSSRPSNETDASRREQLARPDSSSEFRVCSVATCKRTVHVSELASNGAAGVRSWCKRCEADRRREARARRSA